MTGGFSRAIHLVETHKGWATSAILDLPLCRVRQVLELIQQDLRQQAKFQAQLTEWMTKNICAMFATMADSEKQAKSIQKMVEKIKLPLSDEEADVIDDRSFEEIVEHGALVDVSNQPSFEALDAFFQANDME